MFIKLRSKLRKFGESRTGQASIWATNTAFGAVLGAVAYNFAQPVLAWANLDDNSKQAEESVAKLDSLLELAKQSKSNDAAFMNQLQLAVAQTKGALTSLNQNVRLLREQEMANKGYSLSADFFLTIGQAARVGNGDASVGVRSAFANSSNIRISVNEREVVASPGERIKFPSDGKICYVTYVGKAPDEDAFGFVTGCGLDEKSKKI